MMRPPPVPPSDTILGMSDRADRRDESLFKGDQAVLSNQDINRILSARITLYLREAGARFQADLILIYTTRVRNFQHDRLLGGADEVRAETSTEAVLLDVRTGVVIHSAQSSEAISTRKTPGDLNFSQTVAKAEAEAGGKALLKLADSVVAFLRTAEK